MDLTIPHQTLLVTVGPSEAGKSVAAQRIRAKLDQKYNHTRGSVCSVVSSDECRRDLLGTASQKHDEKMMHVSAEAFDLLYEKVERLMSYPVSKPVVIVDSTALNDRFRIRLRKMAEQAGYEQKALVFDQDLEDYHGEVTEVAKRHRRKMKRQMGDITTSQWSAGTKKITDPDNLDVQEVLVEGMKEKASRYVEEPEDRAFIIGDVHGCYSELIELLEKNGYDTSDGDITHPEDLPIVHTGDLVDKNDDESVFRTLSFVRANLESNGGLWHNVVGNHLDWCVRYADGDITGVEDHKHLFDSADMISNRQKAYEMAKEIYVASEPVLYGTHWVCTHAPSRNDQLESIDERMHTRFSYPFRSDFESDRQYKTALAETFGFIGEDANNCLPYHVFGHVTTTDAPYQDRNKIAVDGGCADGGELAGVIINGGYSVYKTSVASKQEGSGPRFNPFDAEVRTYENLSGRNKGRAEHMAEENRQFLAPTMSPAPKGSDQGQRRLESLEQAIGFFDGPVHIQPKYMGSRLQAYLPFTGDPDEDKRQMRFSTRRGFPYEEIPANIDDVMDALASSLSNQFNHPRPELQNLIDHVVLDGELMPWAELGHGLIENQYEPVETGLERQMDAMSESGFWDRLEKLRDSKARETYLQMRHEADKSEIKSEIGSRVYRTMKALDRYLSAMHVSREEMGFGLADYKIQLDKHGHSGFDEEPTFQPFDVLKIVFSDGRQTVPEWPTDKLYSFARPEQKYEPVVATEEDMNEAFDLFERLREDNMEGVVVKPLEGFRETAPPYLKVRTPEYLTLAYGPLYQARFEDFYEDRYVGHKLRVSEKETELAREMLQFSSKDIGSEEYLNCLAAWFAEEQEENELDPTL